MATYSLCGSSVANTGQQACDKAKGVLRKLFIFNGTMDAADYVDEATYHAKLVTNSKLTKTASNKVFVLPEIQEIALTNEANKEGTLNLGYKATILEGRPSYKVKFFGSGDLLQRLQTFNDQTVGIIEYDANDVYWGTLSGTTYKGYQAKVFFDGGYVSDGQGVGAIIELSVSFLSVSEYKRNSFWIDGDGTNVEDIVPLMDVALTGISHTTNVWKIGMGIQGSDLTGAYNAYDEIGALTAALTFTAGTGTNYGTPLAITSVAVDATLKALTVTFDSTAYTALATSTKIKLIPPTPAALDAGSVTLTEILPVILTK